MKDIESNFYALTPRDDADISVYESALDFVFAHNNVRNVAISGSYGAGKSSILASYKKKHTDKKFLHISLAHFHSENGNNGFKNISGEMSTETILEGKILNQLIHQIRSDKIPLTNFRVKKETSKRNSVIPTIIVMASLLLFLYVFFFSRWISFVHSLTFTSLKGFLSFSTHSESRLAAGIFLLVGMSVFVNHLVQLQKKYHIIRKADVQGIAIEIFQDCNESYFDKYLNEVLYLFEKAGSDVIVFEDIDRYDSSEIFGRLREINTLVNNGRERTLLRFFYLMRDDIFICKDRTKFFDFIIPIIPVIDASNSFDKFIECFEENKLVGSEKAVIDLDFLQGLSLYIDDMRILQNICNEFLVYLGRLSTTEQDPNKILAFIAYKNLFPRDFSDLQMGRGFIFEIIGGNEKEKLIYSSQEKLHELIKGKEKEFSEVQNEPLFSDEIAILYYVNLQTVLSRSGASSQPSNNPATCKQRLEQYRNHAQYNEIFNEYDNRLKYSEDNLVKKNARILSIESEISNANRQLMKLNGSRLKDLITRENIDDLFNAHFKSETGKIEDYNSIKDSPYFALLKYLVREGFLDETYSDYMTYFYENSLTRRDKIFLRSVTDKKAKGSTYLLDNPSMVVSRLPLAYLEQEETLNFSLFGFLLTDFVSNREFVDQAKKLIQQITENKLFDFIIFYSEQKNQIVNLVKAFGSEWASFLADLFAVLCIGKAPANPKTKNDIFITKYAHTLLALIGEKSTRIAFLDDTSKECLVEYLSNDASFLSVHEVGGCDEKNVALGIQRLGILFKLISADVAHRPLLERVYHDNSYVLNYGNIETMVEAFYSIRDISVLRTANYSAVMENPESPLSLYVNANIDSYMEVILAECGKSITDTQKNVISLLNNDAIEKTKKISYITCLKTTVSEMQEINDKDLWGELFKNPVAVEYTAKNVIAYFSEKCQGTLDDILLKYINYKGVSISLDNCFENDEKRNAFFGGMVKAVSLSNDIYKDFIKQFNLYYPTFSIEGLPQEKLRILDELGKIKMSAESLAFIREHYNNYLHTFIVRHITEYISVISDSEIFELGEALELLDANIEDAEKIAILKMAANPIAVSDKKYSDDVMAYILQNNYDINDFNNLVGIYSSFGEKARAELLKRAIDDIQRVFPVLNNIDDQLLWDLFTSDSVSEENKKKIFVTLSPTVSDSQIQRWLPCVGSPEFLALYEDRKRPTFENTEWNKLLLDIFKKREAFEDYKLDENSQKYSIIRRRKAQAI